MLRRSLIPTFLAALATVAAAGDTLHVATNGDDAAPGSAAQPWRTIQKAADTAPPGSTVLIHAGSYAELVAIHVSGTEEAGLTTFEAAGDGAVILDGTGLAVPRAETFALDITDRSWIRVRGLEIRGLTTTRGNDFVVGIYVTHTAGEMSHIELIGNEVHGIANTGSGERNAQGIAVYGRAESPLTDLVISGNTVRDCTLGQSEALTVNGNISGFEITANRVHDNDNIGIVAIGFEKTARVDDFARGGVIADNVVHHCSSGSNPTYGGEQSAGGIYVDGGRDIVIERNVVHHCDLGIEVASEHAQGTAERIVVRDNFLYANNVVGLIFGGYSKKVGTTLDCVFSNNTLLANDTSLSGTGEISIAKAHDNVVIRNVIVCNDQGLLVTSYMKASQTFDNAFDRNVYHAPTGDGAFVWNDKEFPSFAAFRQATGQDVGSLESDPRLRSTDVIAPDVRLTAASPAIDAGGGAFSAGEDELDLLGNLRVVGSAVDAGAHEFGSAPAQPTPPRYAGPEDIDVREGVPTSIALDLRGTPQIEVAVVSGTWPSGLQLVEGVVIGTPVDPASATIRLRATSPAGTSEFSIAFNVLEDPAADRDGDGFPNDLERHLDPLAPDDDARTPLGLRGDSSTALDVLKLSIRRKFKRGGRDTLTLTATLRLPDGASVAGRTALLYVGGIVRCFTLDGHGRGKDGDGASLRLKPSVPLGSTRMKVKLTRQDFGRTLTDEGLTDGDIPKRRQVDREVRAMLLLEGIGVFEQVVPLRYHARRGKSGKAELR